MKDSGVEWLGEIPAEWKVKKLKYVAVARPSNIDKKSKDEEEPVSLCNYVDVYKNEFINRELTFMRATAAQEQIEKFLLQKGDILATKDSESPDDIANPALVVEDFDGVVCGYHLTHIKPKKIIGSYLFRYFQTNYLNSYFEVSANGVTRYGLGVDKFDSALILNPSMDEQTAIANFLDRKTTEIDVLIAQKERLLELYEEEKTAIINHAVTKGLDLNAELKDSGIDWLGEIPAGWKVRNLKYVTKHGLQNGIFKKAIDFGSGIKLINVGDMYTSKFLIDENSLERVACTESEVSKYEVDAGDIFFVRSSLKREGIAKAACLEGRNESIVFECHLIKITPKDIAHEYLNYYLNSDLLRHKLISLSITTTMSTISQDAIGSLEVIIPSSKEQTAIVQHIKAETTHIDAKIAKTQRIIELQKEYRTALISEVVTGKIKVPELSTQEASA